MSKRMQRDCVGRLEGHQSDVFSFFLLLKVHLIFIPATVIAEFVKSMRRRLKIAHRYLVEDSIYDIITGFCVSVSLGLDLENLEGKGRRSWW